MIRLALTTLLAFAVRMVVSTSTARPQAQATCLLGRVDIVRAMFHGHA